MHILRGVEGGGFLLFLGKKRGDEDGVWGWICVLGEEELVAGVQAYAEGDAVIECWTSARKTTANHKSAAWRRWMDLRKRD